MFSYFFYMFDKKTNKKQTFVKDIDKNFSKLRIFV